MQGTEPSSIDKLKTEINQLKSTLKFKDTLIVELSRALNKHYKMLSDECAANYRKQEGEQHDQSNHINQ